MDIFFECDIQFHIFLCPGYQLFTPKSLASGVPANADGLARNAYQQFKLALPKDPSNLQFIIVKVTGLVGTVYANSGSPAGAPVDGACLGSVIAPVTCVATSCTFTIDPCQVAAAPSLEWWFSVRPQADVLLPNSVMLTATVTAATLVGFNSSPGSVPAQSLQPLAMTIFTFAPAAPAASPLVYSVITPGSGAANVQVSVAPFSPGAAPPVYPGVGQGACGAVVRTLYAGQRNIVNDVCDTNTFAVTLFNADPINALAVPALAFERVSLDVTDVNTAALNVTLNQDGRAAVGGSVAALGSPFSYLQGLLLGPNSAGVTMTMYPYGDNVARCTPAGATTFCTSSNLQGCAVQLAPCFFVPQTWAFLVSASPATHAGRVVTTGVNALVAQTVSASGAPAPRTTVTFTTPSQRFFLRVKDAAAATPLTSYIYLESERQRADDDPLRGPTASAVMDAGWVTADPSFPARACWSELDFTTPETEALIIPPGGDLGIRASPGAGGSFPVTYAVAYVIDAVTPLPASPQLSFVRPSDSDQYSLSIGDTVEWDQFIIAKVRRQDTQCPSPTAFVARNFLAGRDCGTACPADANGVPVCVVQSTDLFPGTYLVGALSPAFDTLAPRQMTAYTMEGRLAKADVSFVEINTPFSWRPDADVMSGTGISQYAVRIPSTMTGGSLLRLEMRIPSGMAALVLAAEMGVSLNRLVPVALDGASSNPLNADFFNACGAGCTFVSVTIGPENFVAGEYVAAVRLRLTGPPAPGSLLPELIFIQDDFFITEVPTNGTVVTSSLSAGANLAFRFDVPAEGNVNDVMLTIVVRGLPAGASTSFHMGGFNFRPLGACGSSADGDCAFVIAAPPAQAPVAPFDSNGAPFYCLPSRPFTRAASGFVTASVPGNVVLQGTSWFASFRGAAVGSVSTISVSATAAAEYTILEPGSWVCGDIPLGGKHFVLDWSRLGPSPRVLLDLDENQVRKNLFIIFKGC